MTRLIKKVFYLLVTTIYFAVVFSSATVFAADNTMSVTLRIEGIDMNLFYDTEKVPYTDSLTLAQALTYIDKKEDSITISGINTSYITDINGETAAKFGGWDGWLFKVNGKDVSVGIDSLTLSDGDSVLLYYGDPFGVGMQFPEANTSDIAKGVITFTSSDTTYDSNNKAVVKVNPVKNATVTWDNAGTSSTYVTDDHGSIQVDTKQLTAGEHKVQISKVADSGLPLVLRFSPDYVIQVDAATVKSPDKDSTSVKSNEVDSSTADTVDKAPKTGEKQTSTIILYLLAAASMLGIIILKRKENNEKQNY